MNLRSIKKVLLVTGYSRSGTTLMGQILGTSNSVLTLAETHYFENMIDGNELNHILKINRKHELANKFFIRSIKGILGENQISDSENAVIKKNIADLDEYYPQDLTGCDLYICMLDILATNNNVDTICEQTGKYIFFYDVFKNFNVDLKILHMIRNPLDVIRSEALKYRVKFLGLKLIPFFETIRIYLSYNPILLSLVISGFERQYNYLKYSSPDNDIRKFRFENIIRSADYLNEVESFAKINDIDIQKIDFWGSSISKEKKVRQKGIVDTSKVNTQFNSIRVNAGFFWVTILLKNYMKSNNYSNSLKYSYILPGIVWLIISPLQLFFIFILNIKRAPNFILALKRRLL